MSSKDDVTQLLIDWSDGDREALRRLTPIVLDDLHRLAASYLRRERTGHTLQATALVNEVYMRLVDQKRVRWRDRAHFFAVAAQFMRRILVDSARAHRADKRGGWAEKVKLDEASDVPASRDVDAMLRDVQVDAGHLAGVGAVHEQPHAAVRPRLPPVEVEGVGTAAERVGHAALR